MIRSDPHKTQERIARLDDYIRENLLSDGTFICDSFDQCRASRCGFPFYEGQMSHVGKHYDLEVSGRPTRIVVVGQEYGHRPSCVDLVHRSEMIADSANARFNRRNPHMRGTTSLLRLLLGREPGKDKEGERLLQALDSHIFDGFALVNYLLCSALQKSRKARGNSSQTMRRNCASHFIRTLEILEPTVVIVQGKGIRQWMTHALQLPKRASTAEIVDIDRRSMDLINFTHPAAFGKLNWGNLSSEYLKDTVAPTIKTLLSKSSSCYPTAARSRE